jgi:hypothetical protein
MAVVASQVLLLGRKGEYRSPDFHDLEFSDGQAL